MSLSRSGSQDASGPARRAVRWAILAALSLFVIQTAYKALRAPLVVDDFPEALAIKVELLPVIFPVHMVTGGLALLLVPVTLLLRRYPRWHRWAGRITAIDVALAGLTAFPVALVQPVTRVSAWGFTAQGLVWLVLLVLGIRNIRRGNRVAHRSCMLLMAAATSGAVFFRVYLALFAMNGSYRYYEAFYACDAWLAWGLPLLAMAFWLKRTGALAFDHR